jgi:D-3-phosphoglycerate dehydrogenase / 2-oxoglutarate reductase
MKILVVEPIDTAATDWLSQQGADVILGYNGEDWQAVAEDIVALIYRGQVVIDGPYLDQFPSLRVVGKHGVGINTVDLSATGERGVLVTNTPGANANSVAEHAVLLLLAVTRRLVPVDALVRTGQYGERLGLPTVNEVRGSKVGIIGGGRIGRRVAEILEGGFDCTIGLLDPFVPEEDVAYLDPERFDGAGELCDWADSIVVAAPLTEQTRDLISAPELARLGPSGIVVISSRGGIVNEGDLTDAVRRGVVGGAGVDVFSPEPPPPNNPLLELDNVVVTPHYGGHSKEAREAMARMVCQQVWTLLNGGTAPLADQAWL